MTLIETKRLKLRPFNQEDAAFMVELLNDPAFIKNIADRNVRTLEDAKNYLLAGPIKSYEQNGFGLWMVEEKDSGLPAGMCGLIKREALDDVDVGFAFLPAFCGKGYATESSLAVIEYGKTKLGFKRLIAIVNPDNQGSISVLEKSGFKFEKMTQLPPDTKSLKLYSL